MGIFYVKPQLDSSRDLVHILSTRTGGADIVEQDLFFQHED